MCSIMGYTGRALALAELKRALTRPPPEAPI